jgi:multidrug resistance protein, MATE family
MNVPASTPRGELRALLRLSVPLTAGHVGNQVMGLVDTAMVGRLGKAALGGVGIGNGLFFVVTIVAMGCIFGMDAPVSQALGAREPARARRTFWQALRVGVIAGVPTLLVLALLPLVLVPVGVDAEIAADARRYVWARLPGLLPFLFFVACRSYLQALHITRPIVIASVLANVLNVIGNSLLIFGDGALHYVGLPGVGLPALGVVGAAISTSIAQLAMLLVLVKAVRSSGDDLPAGRAHRQADPGMIRTIFRLGLPLGLQMLAEVGVFVTCNVLAGRMSKDASAGYQLAITLASFTFMFALGIGAATGVRVGQAVGRSDTPGARRAGFMGLRVIVGIMAVPALLFLVIPELLAQLFTNDPTVVAAAVPLLRIAAVFQLSDGVQGVAAGALRGAGDPEIALWANVVGHWAVGLPVALILAHGVGIGAPGLWWGLSVGLTVVAIWLSWRFAKLSSRPIRRV